MIHSTDTPPPVPLLKELAELKIQNPPTDSCTSSPFAGKCVSLTQGSSEPIEPKPPTSAVAISERSVDSGFASDPLPATQLGDIVNWGELHQEIRESLTIKDFILFFVYLDIPLNKLMVFLQTLRANATGPFPLIERLIIEENCKITHELLLKFLANSSRPSLVALHCATSGIAADHSQFLSDWPACVQAADTDAALNHKLDIFKLDKFFKKEKTCFFYNIPTTTLAYAAGYPELMDDPNIKQCSKAKNQIVNKVLLKKILDKHGGSITTNEIVKIMSNPEIMRINSAYQLIESLKGNTGPYFRRDNIGNWDYLLKKLAFKLSDPGMNPEHFARSLGIPLHLIQKFFELNSGNGVLYQFEGLLELAILCSPRLTPGHIIHAMNEACKASGCNKELEKWIEQDKRLGHRARLPGLQEFPPEELPKPKPLFWPEDDHSARIASSQPLTLDSLRHLPLSHNWFLIGVTMGLSGDELESIGAKTLAKDGSCDHSLLSLAAPALSGILVKKGLETGHLHQALELLNDQATLPYFPKHLTGQPEKALPGEIAKAYEQGQLTARIVSAIGPKNLRFLTNMVRTSATSGNTFKSLKRPSADNPAAESAPPMRIKAEPSTAGQLHQMHVSSAIVKNEEEFPDINSLSASDGNTSKAGSSEKPIKLNDSTLKATALPSSVTANNVTPIPESSVISSAVCSRLSETQLDDTVYWDKLDTKITRGLSPEEDLLICIYLGYPGAEIANIAQTLPQFSRHKYFSGHSGIVREGLKITHEKLLTILAGVSRFDLVKSHCKNFGIVFESRFLTHWLPDVKAVDDNAALDYPLDFFKLHQIFTGDGYLLKVSTASIAFAAGYPELMADQDLQATLKSGNEVSTATLLKKILDKQGGSMTTNELVKILSHPEINNIRCAHRLIEALKSNPAPIPLAKPHKLRKQNEFMTSELARIQIPADALGDALRVPWPIRRRILNQTSVDETTQNQYSNLLHAAFRSQPELTPEHILYALRKAAGSDRLIKELEKLIADNHKSLSLFQKLNPEPSTVEPIYRQDDDNAAAMAGSKPLTPDFLRRLSLSHNWFSIGFAMGLSVDELRDIHQKTSHTYQNNQTKRDTLAACYLSAKLAELGKKGVETGHLFQALQNLDDQVTLDYFPEEHLPEKALPMDIANAIEQAKSTLQFLNTVDPKELKKILSGYDRYAQMKR
ncbi:hypothetical protein [Endozoicomonas sp. ONNA2]|uniref:hypothetical protein n=1 Tax=Endozoicomonas sp. ONNA2 TaxID=2828741 RepID=UPI002147904F|nr:hypothetical protein [Endozoicomonas sp. ONNA2]